MLTDLGKANLQIGNNVVLSGTCTNADEVTGYEHIADTQTASGELVGDSISLEDCADLCLQVRTRMQANALLLKPFTYDPHEELKSYFLAKQSIKALCLPFHLLQWSLNREFYFLNKGIYVSRILPGQCCGILLED